MNNLKFEAYQISVYCDSIYMILKSHKDLSVAKMLFFVYAINKERFCEEDIYDAKTKKEVLSKEITTISGDFVGYANAMPYIIKAIHILSESKIVSIENNVLHLIDADFPYVKCNRESKFVYNAIEESRTWSDKRFMREVLHNV